MQRLFFFLRLFLRLVKYAWMTVWTVYQLALGALLVVLICLAWRAAAYLHLGDIRSLRSHPPESTAFIDAQRRELRDSLEAARRKGAKALPDTAIHWTWTPMDSVPKTLIDLILVAEDAKFHSHQGFDVEQIEYAIVANHQAGKQARGASTITQQVAKNLYLSGDREMTRKLREAAISLLLEHWLGKERILEVYLNVAQFGKNVFGVQEAARVHFRKPLAQLSQDEMLGLACVLPMPERWHPARQSNGFLAHKQQVLRNYALFRGIRSMADSSAEDWMRGVYDSLGNLLAERRWKGLRTNSPVFWDSTSDASPVKQDLERAP